MAIDAVHGSFNLDNLGFDVPQYIFLQHHAASGHPHLVHRAIQRSGAERGLPSRARLLQRIAVRSHVTLIVAIDDSLVLFRGHKSSSDVWVSTTEPAIAERLVAEIRDRLPKERRSDRVSVCFTDAAGDNRYLKIDARPWDVVRGLYGAAVQVAMDQLLEHRAKPGEARRLILWHGPAGTGKTTAIRALLRAWSWVDPVVVTDPESLLSNGNYLRRTLLEEQDDGRWQLVVLEDAESLLRKDAGSDAISRMLNLCDGLLGQGLRCMFLLTTNTPLGAINPAVIRPGRCLANVEFGPLSAAEAAAILGRPVSGPMTLAEVMATQPVEVDRHEVGVGQYL